MSAEKEDNNLNGEGYESPKDIRPLQTTDRVTLFLMQQLNISSGYPPIILNEEEKERLHQIEEENRRNAEVENLAKEILEEIPNVTDQEAGELIEGAGVTDKNLVKKGVGYITHRQFMRNVKGIRTNDPTLLDLAKKIGLRFASSDDE